MNVSNFVKYSGVIIDNQLNFMYHTAMVAKKLSVAAGVIINKIKHYIPHVMLKSICYTLHTFASIFPYTAYPHLIYCVTIWGNTSKIYLHKIQVKQNRITKVLNKASTFRVKLAPVYNQFSILKLDKVSTLEVSEIMYLVKQNKLPSYLQSYFAQTSEIHTYETRLSKRNSFNVADLTNSLQNDPSNILELRHGTICQKISKT